MSSTVRTSADITAGDPARAAEILVRMSRRIHIPFHLPLGVKAGEGSIALDHRLLAEDRERRAVSRSTDYAEPCPVDFPPITTSDLRTVRVCERVDSRPTPTAVCTTAEAVAPLSLA